MRNVMLGWAWAVGAVVLAVNDASNLHVIAAVVISQIWFANS